MRGSSVGTRSGGGGSSSRGGEGDGEKVFDGGGLEAREVSESDGTCIVFHPSSIDDNSSNSRRK